MCIYGRYHHACINVYGGYACMNVCSGDLSLRECIYVNVHTFHVVSFVDILQYFIYIVLAVISACIGVFIHVFAFILVMIVSV